MKNIGIIAAMNEEMQEIKNIMTDISCKEIYNLKFYISYPTANTPAWTVHIFYDSFLSQDTLKILYFFNLFMESYIG